MIGPFFCIYFFNIFLFSSTQNSCCNAFISLRSAGRPILKRASPTTRYYGESRPTLTALLAGDPDPQDGGAGGGSDMGDIMLTLEAPGGSADTVDTTTTGGGGDDVVEVGAYDEARNTLYFADTIPVVDDDDDDEDESIFPGMRNMTASMEEIMSASPSSRRQWLQQGMLLLGGGGVLAGATLFSQSSLSTNAGPTATGPRRAVPVIHELGRLEPVNFTRVVSETNINVTMNCPQRCVSVDSKNFTKVETAKVPGWFPSFLAPHPKVIKTIPNSDLMIASIAAGSVTEMARTSLLYPVQTVKTRIQTDVHNFTLRPPPIEERLKSLGKNVKRHIQEGGLYAGIAPTLFVAVPATGVYYGTRDVTKRMLSMGPIDDLTIALAGALVGDVVALCFRTPADTLALRLQNQNNTENHVGDGLGNWFSDSVQRLPMVIITDLPYLLSKVFLNRLFIHDTLSIDQYTEIAIITAVFAAFLTTPFDVARTRILVDSNGDFSNGSGQGVFRTMRQITKEGQGGVENLFAGWLERVAYLGIARAWLEPIQIIGYIGIRDAVLLEWF